MVAEASVFENDVPAGWYDDPARPGMQRWWAGSEWTDHVRYADTVRLHAVVSPTPEPVIAVEPPRLVIAPTLVADDPHLGSGFDDFYVPMRNFPARSTSGFQHPTPRQSGRAGGLWLLLIAVVGVATGLALWVFLSR